MHGGFLRKYTRCGAWEGTMTNTDIYQDIAARTGGSLFIGVLGPVRTGKSTFIKRFM